MECKRRAAAANCRPARTHSIVNTHTQQRIVGNHYKMLFIIIIIRNCQRERPAHHFIHTIEECYDKNGLKANGISNEASMAYSRSPKLNNFHNNLIVILPRQDLGIAPPTPIDKKFIYFYFLFKEKKEAFLHSSSRGSIRKTEPKCDEIRNKRGAIKGPWKIGIFFSSSFQSFNFVFFFHCVKMQTATNYPAYKFEYNHV